MRSKAHLVGLVPLLILLVALGAREYDRGGVLTTDTINLLDSTRALDSCIEDGDWSCEQMGRWPPLQYIPAVAFKRLGAHKADAGNDLIYLNGLAVVGILALLWVAGRRSRAPQLAPLAALAGLVSPLLWYGAAGFAEALAGLLTLLFVLACALGWSPWLVGAAALGAVISKETALPFVVVLGIIAILLGPRESRRAGAIALAAGAACGLAVIVLVNLSRYGVPWNRYYLDADWGVDGVGWRLDFFAAQLASPNAGLVWFWPLVAAALALAGAGAAKAALRARTLKGDPGLVLAALAVFAALLLSFASWWAPFGWVAYGARLIFPWVPAVFALVVAAWAPRLGASAGRALRSARGVVALGLVAIVLGLPQLGAFLDPPRPLLTLTEAGVCPPVPDVLARIRSGDARANRAHNLCSSRFAWVQRPMMWDALHAVTPPRAPFAALYALAVAGLIASARLIVRREDGPAA